MPGDWTSTWPSPPSQYAPLLRTVAVGLTRVLQPNIEGVRNLVDFALSSPFQTPPMILNTSSVSVVSAHPTGWVAESSANPLQYVVSSHQCEHF